MCLQPYNDALMGVFAQRMSEANDWVHDRLGIGLFGLGVEVNDRGVAEHLRKGHLGLDLAEGPVLGGGGDHAAALVDGAEDVALELGRAFD